MSNSKVDTDTPQVLVYSTLGCKFCSIAKQTLRQQGVLFSEINVEKAPDREVMTQKSGGATSVPQIFVGPHHVGGCEDLISEVSSGRFSQRLSEAGIEPNPSSLEFGDASSDGGEATGMEVRPLNGILNYHPLPPSARQNPLSASEVVSSLQQRVLVLFDTFVRYIPATATAPARQGVDFPAMRRSKAFAEYVTETAKLRPSLIQTEIAAMPAPARTALFINLYNALLLHASVAVPPGPSDPAARGPFFSGESGARYEVGGLRLSLDDIEHGILRASPGGDPRAFAPDDPRRSFVIGAEAFDARVHFALNCGAKSCPPIKLYAAHNLDHALALAAQAFCESEVKVDRAARTVTLSRILMWYGRDFAPSTYKLLSKLAGYAGEESETRAALQEVLGGGKEGWGEGGGGGWTVDFAPYDWSQNAV